MVLRFCCLRRAKAIHTPPLQEGGESPPTPFAAPAARPAQTPSARACNHIAELQRDADTRWRRGEHASSHAFYQQKEATETVRALHWPLSEGEAGVAELARAASQLPL